MNRALATLPNAVIVCLGLLYSGCSSTSFSRYQGTQVAWPISQGSFVETDKHGVDIIRGLPTRPYEVIGFVGPRHLHFRRRRGVKFAPPGIGLQRRLPQAQEQPKPARERYTEGARSGNPAEASGRKQVGS